MFQIPVLSTALAILSPVSSGKEPERTVSPNEFFLIQDKDVSAFWTILNSSNLPVNSKWGVLLVVASMYESILTSAKVWYGVSPSASNPASRALSFTGKNIVPSVSPIGYCRYWSTSPTICPSNLAFIIGIKLLSPKFNINGV